MTTPATPPASREPMHNGPSGAGGSAGTPPREPTQEMIKAGAIADPLKCDVDEEDYDSLYGPIWRAMYDAAPQAPAPTDAEAAELLRLLHQRYADSGDTLARKAAWKIERQQREIAALRDSYEQSVRKYELQAMPALEHAEAEYERLRKALEIIANTSDANGYTAVARAALAAKGKG